MMDVLERLHHDANLCRNLADNSITADAREILLDMARDYDEQASTLEDIVARPLNSFGVLGDELPPKSARKLC